MTDPTSGRGSIRELLRTALRERMRSRDRDTATVLRAALAEIDNAESAGIVAPQGPLTGGSAAVAAPALGAGSAEAPRRELSEDEMRDLVAAEADGRADLSRRLGEAGSSDAAKTAFEQATALRVLLDVVTRADEA